MKDLEYYFILGVICFIISFIAIYKHFKKGYDGKINLSSYINLIGMSTTLSLFLGWIGAMIVGGITLGIYSSNIEHRDYEKHYLYITSVNRGNDIEGDFFLGSGTIKEKSYYYFYYKSKYGYKLDKVDADNSYIVETDEGKPRITKVKTKYNQDHFIKITYGGFKRYIIYVPKNTIVRDFKLK